MLTVLGVSKDVYIEPKTGWVHKKWDCRCDCGKIISVRGCHLTSTKAHNKQVSCGCHKRKVTSETKRKHGDCGTRLYNIWTNMINRCYNENIKAYKSYGGRGIVMCDEWRNSYLSFKEWAMNSNYSDALTIDRIDVNGNYCPENCRWIPLSEQQKNRTICKYIEIDGRTQIQSDWAREYGLKPRVLAWRLRHGWDLMDALLTPPRRQSNQNEKGDK